MCRATCKAFLGQIVSAFPIWYVPFGMSHLQTHHPLSFPLEPPSCLQIASDCHQFPWQMLWWWDLLAGPEEQIWPDGLSTGHKAPPTPPSLTLSSSVPKSAVSCREEADRFEGRGSWNVTSTGRIKLQIWFQRCIANTAFKTGNQTLVQMCMQQIEHTEALLVLWSEAHVESFVEFDE